MPSENPVVALFSIDGMRPDAIEQTDAPTMRRLMAEGAYTLAAQSVMPSVTLPCHTSMLRGVDVARHGITTNVFIPLARPVPSLMDAAKAAGKRVGFFYNWAELRDLAAPGSVDIAYCHRDVDSQESDWHIARAVADHLAAWDFDFLFVYYGYTDAAGHDFGWMSPPYLEAIANADRCIQFVLDALAKKGRPCVALVQSDHGGHERSHGTEMPEDMMIPWILSGPGIHAGKNLGDGVRIYDTCPTLAALLGVPHAREWDGRIIEEAFVNGKTA